MTTTPQEKWNQKNREKLKEINKKFRSKNKQFSFRLNLEKDKKLIQWLEDSAEKNDMSLQELLHHIVKDAYIKR